MPDFKIIKYLDGEERVSHREVAGRLGYQRADKFAELIERHMPYLSQFGSVPHVTAEQVREFSDDLSMTPAVGVIAKRGQKEKAYLLNEHQATYAILKSDQEAANDITVEMVNSFVAYRKGHAQPRLSAEEVQAMMQAAVDQTVRPMLDAMKAAVMAAIEAGDAEVVRLLKGATWGMTKNQTKHVGGQLDNLNNGIRSVDARVGNVQEELNETRMWTVSRLLKELKVPATTGFARRFSNQLRTYCMDHNLRCDRDPNNRALYRYDIEAARDWLIKGGQAMVDAFMAGRKAEDKARRKADADAHTGQGSLGLPNIIRMKPKG